MRLATIRRGSQIMRAARANSRGFAQKSTASPALLQHSSTPHTMKLYMGLAMTAFAFASSTALNASEDSAVAIKAEEFYNSPSYERRELLSYLQHASEDNPRDVSILWRLARASYDVASLATNPEEKKTLTYTARDVIQRALDIEDDNFAVHKWFGIILSSIGDFEGSKATIANSYVVRDHWLKAIELNPSDATSHNLLGRWCLAIADISWIERQLAAAIFGSPPKATYADALAYFLKADAISPGFWKKNTLQIAQTYVKLNDIEQAKTYVLLALATPSNTDEDKQVHQEAEALRVKLKC